MYFLRHHDALYEYEKTTFVCRRHVVFCHWKPSPRQKLLHAIRGGEIEIIQAHTEIVGDSFEVSQGWKAPAYLIIAYSGSLHVNSLRDIALRITFGFTQRAQLRADRIAHAYTTLH